MAFTVNGNSIEQTEAASSNKSAYHKDFSCAQIREIRKQYVDGWSQPRLAERYGISLKAVYNILHGKTYSYVEFDEGYEEKLKELSNRKRNM